MIYRLREWLADHTGMQYPRRRVPWAPKRLDPVSAVIFSGLLLFVIAALIVFIGFQIWAWINVLFG